MWSSRRLTKIHTSTRPDCVWPGVWSKIGKAAQNLEKQEWAKEKPKIDNARKLRGIYFVHPDDKEYSEILKNARRKLERPMAPAMPCKRMDKQLPSITNVMQDNDKAKEFKTMYGCMVECHESTRQRAESLQSEIALLGLTSMTLKEWLPQAMKILDAKAAVDKEWKKLETIPAWNLENVKSKGSCSGSTKRQKEGPLCFIDGHMPPQKCGVKTQIAELQRQNRAPGGHCKRRLWCLCSFSWTGLVCVPNDCRKSNGCYCRITRVWWTSSWCSICSHSSEIGGCSQIGQNSQIGVSRCVWIRLPRHKWPRSWRNIEDPLVLVERNLYGHPLARLLWERRFEETWLELGYEKAPNWECMFVHRTQGLILSAYVDDIKMAGKKQSMTPSWKKLMSNVDNDEWISLLDHVHLRCTQRECKPNETIIEQHTKMFE